ncbi:MAG: carboxypeptidase-like regulatory domain-containing protein [Rubricoccaceae bacterium]
MPRLALACLFALLTVGSVAAQTNLTGTVTDTDGEPLPGANVYLSGTTRGAATSPNGTFVIENVSPGAYQVVASILGYTAGVQNVQVRGTASVAPLTFQLEVNVAELGNVQVEAEGDARWQRRYRRFKKVLIGESENAARTDIENPWVLDFRESGGTLRATASAPLIIHNQALGYTLYYDLSDFEAAPTRIKYDGTERFEEMEPEDEAQARRWAIARAQAYRGSLRHFLQALQRGTSEAEGFVVTLRKTNGEGQLLEYVGRPVAIDSIVVRSDEPGWFSLEYDGLLGVKYDVEPEVPAYLSSEWFREARSAPEPFQQSNLKLSSEAEEVDPQGNPADPFGISASGYLAFERLGDLVPAEYVPPTEGVQSRAQTRRPPSSRAGSRSQ